jgi:hypothetical protein
MAKLTVDQIRVLKQLTGFDYGFNGKKLKHRRNIYSCYLTGIMTIQEILELERKLNFDAIEGEINPSDVIFTEIYKATERAMKDRNIPKDDNNIFGSVYRFKRDISQGNLQC